MEAKLAGVQMNYILLAIVDAVTDVVLPIAHEFAECMIIARVSFMYMSMGERARLKWLKNIQREGRLGVVTGLPGIWVIICMNQCIKNTRLSIAAEALLH